MSSYVNRDIIHDAADETIVQVNRWAQPSNYTFQIISGTWDLSLTLQQLNRENPPTPDWQPFSVVDSSGAAIPSSSLGVGVYVASNTPAEFIQCDGSGEMILMQGGSTGG